MKNEGQLNYSNLCDVLPLTVTESALPFNSPKFVKSQKNICLLREELQKNSRPHCVFSLVKYSSLQPGLTFGFEFNSGIIHISFHQIACLLH